MELQIEIFRLVFATYTKVLLPTGQPLLKHFFHPILLTCKQLYRECRVVAFHNAIFKPAGYYGDFVADVKKEGIEREVRNMWLGKGWSLARLFRGFASLRRVLVQHEHQRKHSSMRLERLPTTGTIFTPFF